MANNSQNHEGLEKAKAFFERAEEVADTGNYDYAIDMFLEGLRRAPDEVEQGHSALRQMALLRQSKGGKKPSMMEKLKHTRGKGTLEEMLNSEWLLAHDPENISYAEGVLKAATTGQFKKTAAWIADMLFTVALTNPKHSLQTFLMLKDSYAMAGEWEKAIGALHYAIRLKPDDLSLTDELRNLSAELAVKAGKYGEEGDFRQSIKDKDLQERMQSQDAVIKTESYKVVALNSAKKDYEKNPDAPNAVYRYADALADMETEETFKEAYDLLEKNAISSQDFNFKRRAGEIKIKHLSRIVRAAKTAADLHADDFEAKNAHDKLHAELAAFELEHYHECVQNYPTDPHLKYEYGIRLMRNRQFDEAIPFLQEAQKDPRHRFIAMDNIGTCFFLKGWYIDAADIFRQALDSYEIKDDAIAKDLRYNLARSLEEQGKADEALEIYRKLAQLDFSFRDVRQRVDKLRNQG